MFVALVRLLALVVSFQLSGLAHVASDLVEEITVGGHHETSHDDESDADHDCPPGCPTCHHAHHGAAPLSASAVAVIPPTAMGRAHTNLDERTPPSPALPSLYRPPRV